MFDKSLLVASMDIVLALLLVGALLCLWRFNRRLDEIRRGKDEFKTLIAEFARSTGQAGATLLQLKASAETVGRDLANATGRASVAASGHERIAEDLKMLIARGEALADRMESLNARSRTLVSRPSPDFTEGAHEAANRDENDASSGEPAHPALAGLTGLR
jgi:methyl-accepting chemotaxis protein